MTLGLRFSMTLGFAFQHDNGSTFGSLRLSAPFPSFPSPPSGFALQAVGPACVDSCTSMCVQRLAGVHWHHGSISGWQEPGRPASTYSVHVAATRGLFCAERSRQGLHRRCFPSLTDGSRNVCCHPYQSAAGAVAPVFPRGAAKLSMSL